MAGPPQARANTYLFSFSTASLMSAIGSTYNNDGFFAFWFQVETNTNQTITSKQNTVVQNPDPSTNPDSWTQSNYFTDPSDGTYNQGTGVWIQYSKQANQQFVSLATTAGTTIFSTSGCTATNSSTCQYSDSGTYPLDFGTFNGGNSGVNNANVNAGTFAFSIDTGTTVLSTTNSYNLLVIASYINPGGSSWPSPPLNLGAKTHTDQTFTVSIGPPTLTAIPEPGSWMLMGIGAAWLAGVAWKNRRAARANTA